MLARDCIYQTNELFRLNHQHESWARLSINQRWVTIILVLSDLIRMPSRGFRQIGTSETDRKCGLFWQEADVIVVTVMIIRSDDLICFLSGVVVVVVFYFDGGLYCVGLSFSPNYF